MISYECTDKPNYYTLTQLSILQVFPKQKLDKQTIKYILFWIVLELNAY